MVMGYFAAKCLSLHRLNLNHLPGGRGYVREGSGALEFDLLLPCVLVLRPVSPFTCDDASSPPPKGTDPY